MSKETQMKHINHELDMSNAGRGLWLVKVPKYLASRMERATGNREVGKIHISKAPGQKAQLELRLNEAIERMDPSEPIPKRHRLDLSTLSEQKLCVFSHQPTSKPDDPAQVNDEIYMDGRVVQKLECRPIANAAYLSLKREAVRRAAEPARKVVTLDRIVQNFKPVSDHKHNIEYREKKKAEGKKAREDIHAVQEMLFKAFEAHQYYNIRDLVRITKQPIGYLKDVMKEVCDYNVRNPHKNMWELKKEYRHYSNE